MTQEMNAGTECRREHFNDPRMGAAPELKAQMINQMGESSTPWRAMQRQGWELAAIGLGGPARRRCLLIVHIRRETQFRPGGAGGILQLVSRFLSRATMMTLTIEATYENGVLKPAQPLPLKEQERVQITVHTASDWVTETAGMIPWTGDHATLRHLAEMSNPIPRSRHDLRRSGCR